MQRTTSTGRTGHGRRPDDEVGLAVLLRAWRARVGLRQGLGRPLPQVDVAARIGMSERWYRDLERGATPRMDARTLAALSDALRLCADERAALFLHAAGGELFPAVSPADADLAPLRRLLDQRPECPAYLTDNAWNVLAHNEAMAEWFPWVRRPGANLIRWGLLSPEARERLADWPRHGRAYLAMLRYAMAQYPAHPELAELLRTALADPACRRIWDDGPVVVAHRDGHTFRLSGVPRFAPRTVDVVARVLHPVGCPGFRLTFLEPAA
ncbi:MULTISPECIES: helix-turn-helix transcriptional regulator [Streptomyces]|uniref:helix-turn-helix transcriptional regulator n=1 Tax=Streptomyces TaxID=1883 RepID=UPI00163D07BB|nr:MULTISPECIES: helix-turn-helix transcriptional regulator [Streptomyces]MBC2876509.1 helix-turn-helix domain-containing protein [Streptomyces sp. TYQ1024]UBI40815.1 helix-turn-helix transcriptional regulator [Streptomyces mobaraensis]